ncbi:MAG: winged helix-turn-helix transcriptional regulator [Oscillospiraceae bacterium]|nr:winged helix-turn-helix transcriptional regulator [Oscillospiraceae bacterium]
MAFDLCEQDGHASISDMAEYLGISKKSVSRYIKEYEEDYYSEKGLVFRKNQ